MRKHLMMPAKVLVTLFVLQNIFPSGLVFSAESGRSQLIGKSWMPEGFGLKESQKKSAGQKKRIERKNAAEALSRINKPLYPNRQTLSPGFEGAGIVKTNADALTQKVTNSTPVVSNTTAVTDIVKEVAPGKEDADKNKLSVSLSPMEELDLALENLKTAPGIKELEMVLPQPMDFPVPTQDSNNFPIPLPSSDPGSVPAPIGLPLDEPGPTPLPIII